MTALSQAVQVPRKSTLRRDRAVAILLSCRILKSYPVDVVAVERSLEYLTGVALANMVA